MCQHSLDTYTKWLISLYFLLHIQVAIAVDERNNHLDRISSAPGLGSFDLESCLTVYKVLAEEGSS